MRRREVVRIPVLNVQHERDDEHIRYDKTAASRRRFEDRFQALAKQTFDAAFECRVWHDGAGVGEALAGALRPLLGFAPNDPRAPQRWQALIHPDDHLMVEDHLQRVLGGQRDLCVFRGITPTRAVRWFGVLTRPVWDASGRRVAYTYSVVQDHSATALLPAHCEAPGPSRRPPLAFPERLL